MTEAPGFRTPKDKKSVVVMGCLQETLQTLTELISRGFVPDALVGITKDEAMRHDVTNFFDVEPIAHELGIPYKLIESYALNRSEDVQTIQDLDPSVLLVVGWQRLVPPEILDLVGIAAVGFHGSANILPWGRGRSPINWSIIEGRDRFVLHMFVLQPGVDDGDIVGLRVYDINPWDTCRTVYYKTAIAQAELIHRHLPEILAGRFARLPQTGDPFYYPKRTPQQGLIDWSADAETICRLIRGVTRPYPGAFTTLRGEDLRIWGAQPFSRDFFQGEAAGRVCFISQAEECEFVVACRGGSVLVTDADLAGRSLSVGDLLGS